MSITIPDKLVVAIQQKSQNNWINKNTEIKNYFLNSILYIQTKFLNYVYKEKIFN